MENCIGYAVAGLLSLSSILLGILIPGGPIENRNFSHISSLRLLMFNLFLTVLGIGSFALVYFLIVRTEAVLFIAAAICGISYFLVYALDLGKIFPVSPDKMPKALFGIEVIGLILSMPLIFLSFVNILISNGGVNASETSSGTMIVVLAVMVIMGVGIVIYATKSAMRKSPNKANSADARNRAAD